MTTSLYMLLLFSFRNKILKCRKTKVHNAKTKIEISSLTYVTLNGEN